jgi:hypothetical protein
LAEKENEIAEELDDEGCTRDLTLSVDVTCKLSALNKTNISSGNMKAFKAML